MNMLILTKQSVYIEISKKTQLGSTTMCSRACTDVFFHKYCILRESMQLFIIAVNAIPLEQEAVCDV